MILVDTSIWVDHLRRGSHPLQQALERGDVTTHPFVIGELACGHLPDRRALFGMLDELPAAPVASNAEVREMIERRALMGRGLGFVDVHLLAATALAGPEGLRLWTRDAALAAAAADLGLAYDGPTPGVH